MEYIGVWLFMGSVIVAGVGIGFWLQAKLEGSHQDITYPGAFAVRA